MEEWIPIRIDASNHRPPRIQINIHLPPLLNKMTLSDQLDGVHKNAVGVSTSTVTATRKKEIPDTYLKYRNNNSEVEDSESRRKRKENTKGKDLEREKKRSDRHRSKSRRNSHSDKENSRKRRKSSEERSRSRRDDRSGASKRSRREKTMDMGSDSDECAIYVDTSTLRSIDMKPAFNSNIVQRLAREAIDDGSKDPIFSFSAWAEAGKGLTLKRADDVKRPLLASDALGASFDRVLRAWICTDTCNGKIVVASYDGRELTRCGGFKKPSAIAIIKPGSHFAVLDYNGITMIDVVANTKIMIADGFRGMYRGLGKTSDGNLVTIEYTRRPPRVCVFNLAKQNNLITWIDYTNYRYDRSYRSFPCFLCTKDAMIYTTDLNRNALSAFSYDKETQTLSPVSSRDLSNSARRTSLVQTRFMSGVVVDSANSLLVADALGHSIFHVAANGSLIQKIPFIDASEESGPPYISGMAISPTGRLMVCCRRQHTVRLYDLVRQESDEDRLAKAIKEVTLSKSNPFRE